MNNGERIFSIEGSHGLSHILLKDGELYLVTNGCARPLSDGDIDIHPEHIHRYVYMQEIPKERRKTSEERSIRWVLDEVSLSNFNITSSPMSWPGFRVERRELSAHQ